MDQEAVGTYVRLALEGPLVAFYVTVLLCIVCGMLRGSFRSGFFKIYLLLCFADLTEYSAIVIFYRLPRVGALEGLWKNGYGRLGVFLNVYFLLFQMSAHTAIALNRYFTIVMPLSKWNLELKGKKFFFALVVLSGLPLTTCWVSMVCRTWGIVESSQAGIYVITCDTPSSYAISSIGIGIYSVVTSIISFMLELKTYIVYRRHSKHLKCRHVEDYRLLVFAMLTFVGQFMHTARSAVIIVVMYFFAGNRDVTGIVQILTYTYLAELFCLGSPICLFITSRLLRNKYRQMYFFMLPSARVTAVTPSATSTNGFFH